MNIYAQLYDILRDAIYGAEAVLTDSQLFLLEQISTYGAIAVTLLPVIALIAITVKLLRW